MDFGRGVGRLLYPLALRAESVIGVDASPTMLALAREKLTAPGVDNWQLVQSVSELRAAAPAYDFIHSALVFQHIRPPEGYAAFRELVVGLSAGGCGVVHFLVRTSLGPREIIRYLRAR